MVEQFSEHCEVKTNDKLGRHIVAALDIKLGTILLKETPLLVLPRQDSTLCCCNCFRECMTICKVCKIFPLCMHCSVHNNFECNFVKEQNIQKNFLIENFAVYGPLKCLLLMENPATVESFNRFIDMESHVEARHGTAIWKENDHKIVQPLLKSGIIELFKGLFKIDSHFLQRICGIIDVNAFEIRGPEGPLRALFVNAALLAHSCIGNTLISVDEKYILKLHARLPIKRGEIVYYNYLNPLLRRYVVATADIAPGKLLLKETPILVIPQWDSALCCSNCFTKCKTICKTCKVFPLCLHCSTHDSFDCAFFKGLSNIQQNFLLKNFSAYGPLKCLLLMENPETTEYFQSLMSMEAHMEARRGSSIWKEHENNIVQPLLESGIIKYFKNSSSIDSELIQQICGILDVNIFGIRAFDGTPLRGFYVNAAILAHSCKGNTLISVDEKFEMRIYARQTIKKGKIVYNTYTNPLMGTLDRKEHLKIGKYFNCTCERCEDPTELGTYMSAIKCQACGDGFVINKINSTWSCTHCFAEIAQQDILDLVSKAKHEVESAQEDIRRLEILISKYSQVLHPNHHILIDLKQKVAAILRMICMNGIHKPGRKVLQRKIQLCEEILPVIRIVHPGISRLTAIALYEYYTPFVDLISMDYEERNISAAEYLEKLKQSEVILKEAIGMLLYEPNNTPEGQLARRAMLDLKDLRQNMDAIQKIANVNA